MRERVTELKGEMETVKEVVTTSSFASSSTTVEEGSSQVHVDLKGKGSKGVEVKVASEE